MASRKQLPSPHLTPRFRKRLRRSDHPRVNNPVEGAHLAMAGNIARPRAGAISNPADGRGRHATIVVVSSVGTKWLPCHRRS